MKKWLLIPICTVLALAIIATAACVIIWNQNEFTLQMTLNGEKEITLEYGADFTDPGATASYQGTLLEKEATDITVQVEGQVDTSKVGTYTLTYSASCSTDYKLVSWADSATLTRTVHIVDTQAPTITLVSDPDGFTFPNETYVEEGFRAVDGYDGDITDKVERIETHDSITYRVSDSSGNSTEVIRPIVYDDPIPPTLTLLGETTVKTEYYVPYSEPGFTAEDNVDGDLTGSVVVEGTVDCKTPGDYIISYTVTDSYGNTVTAQRTVTVLKKNVPNITLEYPDPPLAPTGKVIYLTFDDGPGKYTSQLLDILAKYNVKATFFVTYNGYADLLPRMAAEGHTIAMHTATHDYKKIYASEEAYFEDLFRIQGLIEEKTGTAPKLLRFPGGSSNTVSSFNQGIMTRLVKKLEEMGYYYFDWNVDSKDAGGASSATEVLYNVVAGIGKKQASVVLQHDIKGFSVAAVEEIIRWGIANGYTFLPMDETSPGCHHGVRN